MKATAKFGNTANTDSFIDSYPVTGIQIRCKAEFRNSDTTSAQKPSIHPPKGRKSASKRGDIKALFCLEKTAGKYFPKEQKCGSYGAVEAAVLCLTNSPVPVPYKLGLVCPTALADNFRKMFRCIKKISLPKVIGCFLAISVYNRNRRVTICKLIPTPLFL